MSELTPFQIATDFPMLKQTMHGKPLVYLDTAATAQKPLSVIEAINDFYQNHYGTVHRAVYELSIFATDRYQKVREKIAAFLGAKSPSEIIFTRGTTESINLVAASFGKAFIKPGDEIIISEMEHHSNLVPWQMAAEERGARLLVIPFNDQGVLDMEAYKRLLSSKTKIVAVAHISNVLGTVNPIREITRLAHESGAKVLVDGAQSAPHCPVSVNELGADFYVFSGHKAYGPTGIGVLYGKESLLEKMPPYQGGGDMIQKVTLEHTTYNTLPLKFEAGTPLIAEVIGLGAAIDYLEAIGRKRIFEHEKALFEYAKELLSEVPGIRFIGDAKEKAGIISFLIDGIHPLDIGTMLDLKGVAIRTGHLCAQPVMQHYGIEALARASFGVYTTKSDVEKLAEALISIQKMF